MGCYLLGWLQAAVYLLKTSFVPVCTRVAVKIRWGQCFVGHGPYQDSLSTLSLDRASEGAPAALKSRVVRSGWVWRSLASLVAISSDFRVSLCDSQVLGATVPQPCLLMRFPGEDSNPSEGSGLLSGLLNINHQGWRQALVWVSVFYR